MQVRNVSGLKASAITLGCNRFGEGTDQATAAALVRAALDSGVTSFDTAVHYGHGDSERFLGGALGADRSRVLISSKCGLEMQPDGGMRPVKGRGTRAFIVEQAEGALRRLGTDWIDQFFVHRHDPDTPAEETLEALDRLVAAGKIRVAGLCNVPAPVLRELHKVALNGGWHPYRVGQYEYSLINRGIETEVVPVSAGLGMALMAYFPLAGGFLTGKYRRDAPLPEGSRMATTRRHADRFLIEHNWAILDRVRQLASVGGGEPIDYAVSWLLAQPRILSVICGASTVAQLQRNIAAASFRLPDKHLAALSRVSAATDS